MPVEAAQDPVRRDPDAMFGPYRLEETIGRGGMGEVFRAHDTVRDRTVALKRLRPGLAQDVEYQERFRRESRVAARLSSPHVVPIHDFGEIDGSLYIDMRLVSGVDLAAEIRRCGRLEPARVAEIVRQVADALDAAHADDLVHRDVKPSNVLLVAHRGRDFVYLVDFGIVRSVGGDEHSRGLTSAGLAIGTMSYMAPEMFLEGTVDRRADVYALACVLFESLAGRPPFTGEGPALMHEHLHGEAPRLSALLPGIPAAVDAVIRRGLVKDPDRRYASAGDLADAAHAALTGVATSPTATGTGPQDAPTWVAPLPPTPRASAPSPAVSLDKPPAVTPPAVAPFPSGPVLPPGHPSGPQDAGPQDAGPSTVGPPNAGPSVGSPATGPFPPSGRGPCAPYGPPSGPGPAHGPSYGPPSGPGWGPHGAPYPPPSAPRPRRGNTAAWVVLAVVATLVVVLGALLVVGLTVGDPSSRPASAPTAPSSPSAAPAATVSAGLRAAFPDIATRTCEPFTPAGDEYTTSTGARPVAIARCAYTDAAPNGYVYYVQWPDQAAADRYAADLTAGGPTMDGTDVWGPGQERWGPLHTRQVGGFVYATGTYDGRPYSFDITVASLAERDALLRVLTLRPAAQIPTG